MNPTTTDPTFNIYVMSRKRSDKILTKNVFEYCTYVVREEEAEEYRKSGINDMLVIPDGAVEDFMTTLYWIIGNTPENIICVADDDISYMIYRSDKNYPILDAENNPDKETSTRECERIGQLIYDLEIGMAFDNPTAAPWYYDKEFAFKGSPGHIRWINKKCLKAKLNVDDPATSDIDMALQELMLNRITLLPKYFCAHAGMDTNGGSKNARKVHLNLTYALKNKWGAYYVYDPKKNVAKIFVSR